MVVGLFLWVGLVHPGSRSGAFIDVGTKRVVGTTISVFKRDASW
jgi:hypothetical protein